MNPAVLALLIPILAVGGPMAIAFFGMMMRHQQKMAELYHRNAPVADPRVDALQGEIAQLKDLIHQQTIALDRMATPLPNAEIRERIGG